MESMSWIFKMWLLTNALSKIHKEEMLSLAESSCFDEGLKLVVDQIDSVIFLSKE